MKTIALRSVVAGLSFVALLAVAPASFAASETYTAVLTTAAEVPPVDGKGSGTLTATPFPKQDSSMMSLLSKSDGLIVRPPKDPARKAGDSVRVLPFASAIPAI